MVKQLPMTEIVRKESFAKESVPFADTIQNLVWGLLVFLSFSLPVNFQPIKICLLVFLLLFLFVKISSRCSGDVLKLAFIWLLFSLPVSAIGFSKGNMGAFAFAKVELIYPILLFLCILFLKNKSIMSVTYKAMIYSSIFISLYTFLLLLQRIGVINVSGFWIIDDTSDAALHDGYTHITNTNLSMLIFIFPCILLLNKEERNKLRLNPILLCVAIFASAFAMLLSGRRILWIIEFICFFLYFLRIKMRLSRKIATLAFVIIIAIVSFVFLGDKLGFSVDSLKDRLINVFQKTDELGGENVRFVQMSKLINGFKENFLFGAGGGATIDGYYRSSESPWVFEASYHMILFNSGIIFSLVYLSFFFYLCYLILKMRKKCYFVISIFFALLFAIIANATNPYFSASFDFLFFIFIPILYINNKEFVKKQFKE